MPDYSKSKIYAIRAHNTDDIYIGSTVLPLSRRLAQHRADYSGYKNGLRHYLTSYKILELDTHYIELIENYPCNSKEELNRREGEVIRTSPTAINRCVAGRTNQEWRETNREELNKKKKEYYQKNKEEILKKAEEYRETNREAHNQSSMDWYRANRDEIAKRRRQRYQDKKLNRIENEPTKPAD